MKLFGEVYMPTAPSFYLAVDELKSLLERSDQVTEAEVLSRVRVILAFLLDLHGTTKAAKVLRVAGKYLDQYKEIAKAEFEYADKNGLFDAKGGAR